MADWSITKAQYERNCFSKPLLNGRYEFILNRYAWREYDWMPLSLKSIFYNTSGSFHDNNEPLYSCLETWMTRAAHSQRGGSIWLWLECMEQEYLVNPQTTGFVLGEKTSLGTRKCTFVRFKEASVLADLLRSVWVWNGGAGDALWGFLGFEMVEIQWLKFGSLYEGIVFVFCLVTLVTGWGACAKDGFGVCADCFLLLDSTL